MDITQEMVDRFVNDLSINGEFYRIFEMIDISITKTYGDERIEEMISTLKWCGKYNGTMSKIDILLEYSKLL